MQSRFPEISISRLAAALKVDRRTVAKRLEHLGDEATLEQVIAALVTSEGIEEARRRKTQAEAKRVELKLQQEQGELVAKREVEKELIAIFKALYNQCVVVVPQRVAERCVGKGITEVQTAIQREYGATFDQLRNDWRYFSSSDPEGGA